MIRAPFFKKKRFFTHFFKGFSERRAILAIACFKRKSPCLSSTERRKEQTREARRRSFPSGSLSFYIKLPAEKKTERRREQTREAQRRSRERRLLRGHWGRPPRNRIASLHHSTLQIEKPFRSERAQGLPGILHRLRPRAPLSSKRSKLLLPLPPPRPSPL